MPGVSREDRAREISVGSRRAHRPQGNTAHSRGPPRDAGRERGVKGCDVSVWEPCSAVQSIVEQRKQGVVDQRKQGQGGWEAADLWLC